MLSKYMVKPILDLEDLNQLLQRSSSHLGVVIRNYLDFLAYKGIFPQEMVVAYKSIIHPRSISLDLLESLNSAKFSEMSTNINEWPDFQYMLNYGSFDDEAKEHLIKKYVEATKELLKDNDDPKELTEGLKKQNQALSLLEENLFIRRTREFKDKEGNLKKRTRYYSLPPFYYILKRASGYNDKPQIITSSALARDKPLYQAQIFSYSDLLLEQGFPLYFSATITFLREETPEEIKSVRPVYFHSIDILPEDFRQSFGSNKLQELFVRKYVKEKKEFRPLSDRIRKYNARILWGHLYKELFKDLAFPNNANAKIWAITFSDVGNALKERFQAWKFTNFSRRTQGLDTERTDKAVLIIGDLTNKETITSLESVYYNSHPISDWFVSTYDGFAVKDEPKEIKDFVWTVIVRESIEYLMRGRGKIPVIHIGKMYHREDNKDTVERVFNEMKIKMQKPRAVKCPRCNVKNIALSESSSKKCQNCKSTIWLGLSK